MGPSATKLPPASTGPALAPRSGAWKTWQPLLVLGNHGGGPTRRHLLDVRRWAEANPQVEVIYSGLERFFDALRSENADLPVIRGEMNFTLRGCYSSAARFKALYRKTENLLFSAEKTDGIISAALGAPASDLSAAWRSVLFNSFHDILPGSSIERAYDDQFAWLGVAWHEAQRAELAALNTLAHRIDTTVQTPPEDMPSGVPILVWNPHPFDYEGPVEFEACIDYRPIETYQGRVAALPVELLDEAGRPLFFQRLEPESYFAPKVPWRVRMAATLRVPAMGWHVVQMAWTDRPRLAAPPSDRAELTASGGIQNRFYEVRAKVGDQGAQIFHNGKPLLGPAGLRVGTYDDIYGSWGGHDGETEADSIVKVKEYWRIERIEPVAAGPEKASLWVRLTCGSSRIDLTFSLHRGCDRLHVSARLFCDVPGCRIKLILPGAEEATFEVPGGTQRRIPCGEVPGGRWVRTGALVFASDALFNFDLSSGGLNATLMRSARYSCSVPTQPESMPWRPYMDGGEHRFQFALAPVTQDPFQLADLLEQPLIASPATPHPGSLPRTGSLGRIEPSHLRLLAFKPAEARDGWILRVQEIAGLHAKAGFWLDDARIALGNVRPFQIVTWKLVKEENGWSADFHDASENPRIGAHAHAAESLDGNAAPNGETPKDGLAKHRASPAVPVFSET